MQQVVVWMILCGLLLISFIVSIVIFFVRKGKGKVFPMLLLFLAMVLSASWTTYLIFSKSYHRVATALTPRSGEEIYAALFGKADSCLKVINHQDAVVPKIDYAIWLYVSTCPHEMERILSRHTYEVTKESTHGWNTTGPFSKDNWFKPEQLGDSILIFTYSENEHKNVQTLYASTDSTKMFCIDIVD